MPYDQFNEVQGTFRSDGGSREISSMLDGKFRVAVSLPDPNREHFWIWTFTEFDNLIEAVKFWIKEN